MKTRILILALWLPVATAARAQYTYITNNNAITITGYTGFGGFVTIPSNINGLTVTSIGNNAFQNSFFLDNVTIPNTVTNIGDNAFSGCSGLSSVTIGSGVISIGNYAFNGCFILGSGGGPDGTITIPASVVSIGDEAFSGTDMVTVMIPAGVTNLGNNPFASGYGLGAINVATNNPAYTSVAGVLYNKDQTLLIGFPAGNGITSYGISNSVASIGNDAFAGCSKLAVVLIPNSVSSIGDTAFAPCSSLTNVTIPNTVTNIGKAPFESCNKLTAISLAPGNTAYISVAGVLFNLGQTTLIEYPGGGPAGPYTIPNTVTNIGCLSFANCGNLTGVTISSNAATIGTNAFNNCESLATVAIANGVTSIGEYAFATTGLTNVVLPDSVTNIGAGAFTACYGLSSINIPDGITNIAYSEFSLTDLTNIVIPASVIDVGDQAFSDCGYLSGIYFEGNAPAVSSNSFHFSEGSTAYYLPDASGWGPTYGGRPTAIWRPVIQGSGIQGGQFGFNISWASNMTVTVEAKSDLNSMNWTALQSCTLTNGSFNFSDASSGNPAKKFYRLSWP